MAGYLRKYVGTYRVLANYDLEKNDYPRVESGQIDTSFDDIYIDCSYGNQIYHFGQSTLVAYIPSKGRGRNITKTLYIRHLGSTDKFIDEENEKIFDYNSMYRELANKGIVFDVEEADNEVTFKFKARSIEEIADLLKAKTAGAKISPFSVRNLPKTKYDIPLEDLAEYKEITVQIPRDKLLGISHITNRFINDVVAKTLKKTLKRMDITDVKADMRFVGLKGKEYIHSLGNETWNKYINYLKENLNNGE